MSLIDEIKNGESKTLEFKKEFPNNESIAKTVIAFSNTSGGKLIIGVDNNGKIIGLKENVDIFDLQDKIASIIYDDCYPNIIPEIYTANIDGKIIIVVEVFRGSLLPYYFKKEGKNNGTYIRIGATNRKASYDNILELERQKRNISFDEEINYDVDFYSLDISPIRLEFEKVGKQIDMEKLKNLKLIKEENGKIYPTNGLLILLGKYENCAIKCARFKGKTMDIFLDKKDYNGDLFSQLEKAESFIKNHINLRGEIKGLQRTDTYEIPIEAIREALINAVVHRDYTNMGRDIKVGIYDDILNIVSPGGFPSTLTEKDILEGRSEVRNKVIARVFKELNYIEQWGSGIKRIKSTCLKYGLKEPIIKETGDFVDVEIYREVPESAGKVPESAGKVPEKYRDLSEQEMRIIEYIKNNGKITSKEVEKLIGVKNRRAREILKEMIDRKVITRKGRGRSTYYSLRAHQK
ncbi:helix-turn-helix domain-containing protein [Caloranaerobacter azorensis]|uniref:AlbA family DNA-binding domain-containing protein n=1 Tax=Caloranaerobacter azorensis TaxID=116090 RepID=UPI0011608EBB|nr:helix-turn-helix domain-containing protein [Caloranaerobacter azorensis]